MSFVVHNSTFDKKYLFENTIEYLNDLIEKDKISDLYLIVPTNRLVHYYKNYIIKRYSSRHNKPISEINIFNFDNFVIHIFNNLEINKEYHLMSDGLKMILLEKVINTASLNYYRYKQNKLRLDVVNQIGDAILNLRKQGLLRVEYDIDLLNEYQIYDKDKSNDINTLLNLFDDSIPKNFYDIPKIYDEMIKYLQKLDTNMFISKLFLSDKESKYIIFNGFTEFKKTELSILSYFANIPTPTALFFDYSEVYGPVFGNIQETISSLFQSGFKLFSTENILVDDNQENVNFRDILKRDLFNINKIKYLERLREKVNIYEVSTINDELKNIVKLVKFLNLEKGIKLSEIAIVTRKPELYAQPIFENFKSANIPINITHRKTLDNSILVSLVILIIKIISRSFTIDELKTLIDNPFLDLGMKNPNNFKSILQLLRIQSDYITFNNNYVTARASSYISYLTEQGKKTNDYHYTKYVNNTIPKIRQFISDYENLETLFSGFSTYIEDGKIKSFIESIINKFGIIHKLQDTFEKIKLSTKDYKFHNLNYLFTSYEAEAQALNQLIIVFNDISLWYKTQKIDERLNKVEVSELLERLNIAITRQPYQIKLKDNYGVLFTSIEQIRQLPLKARILCGANDGIFPQPYSTDKLTGKEIYDSKISHYRSEKVLFYQFLNFNIDADNYAFIFYPILSNGYKILPSPFLEHLKIPKNIKIKNNEYQNFDFNRIIISNKDYSKLLFHQGDKSQVAPINLSRNIQINMNNNDKSYVENKSYSVGDFETYSKCPYKYYVDKFLNYPIKTITTDSLNFLELGDLYHKILYKFYSEVANNSFSINNPIKLNSSKFNEYRNILFKIINSELSNPIYKHPLVKVNTRNLLSNSLSVNPILRFIHFDIKQQVENSNYPIFFEYEIRNIQIENDNKFIKLNLKIDRIERDENVKLQYIVADYKSNDNNVNDKKISNLTSFQMPLYILAMQTFLTNQNIENDYKYGIYYFFNYYDKQNVYNKVLESKENSDKILTASKNEMFRIKDAIYDGIFSITKIRDNCKYCNYAALCRKNQ